LKEEATTKFQEIAFAYAVLSDPIRRKRYDVTGSTAESLSIDEDFSWADFYSEQFRDVVTSDAIDAFSKIYKGSDEEKDDVLAAYEDGEGVWDAIYEAVMLSNPLEDEERFRGYIDEAIEKGEVKAFKAYTKESKKAKKERMDAAKGEAAEAEEMAKELGVHDKLFKKGKGSKKEADEDALKALIQGRAAGRSSFLDNLEAKYAGQQKKGKKGKGKRGSEEVEDGEPSEEAFQAAAARLKNGKTSSEASGARKVKKAKR
jgi:DnaJ family protein C protein 9